MHQRERGATPQTDHTGRPPSAAGLEHAATPGSHPPTEQLHLTARKRAELNSEKVQQMPDRIALMDPHAEHAVAAPVRSTQ